MTIAPKLLYRGEEFHNVVARIFRNASRGLLQQKITSEEFENVCEPLYTTLLTWGFRHYDEVINAECSGLSKENADRVYTVLDQAWKKTCGHNKQEYLERLSKSEKSFASLTEAALKKYIGEARYQEFLSRITTEAHRDHGMRIHVSSMPLDEPQSGEELLECSMREVASFLREAAEELEKLETHSMLPEF